MKCKNKHFSIKGYKQNVIANELQPAMLDVIVTNDELGKTVSVNDGNIQFIFPADEVAKWLK